MFGVSRINSLARYAAPTGVRVTGSSWTTNYSGSGGTTSTTKKFGTNSLSYSSTGSNYGALTFGNTSSGTTNWNSSTPMCIEFWFQISSVNSGNGQVLFSTNSTNMSSGQSGASAGTLILQYNSSQATWKFWNGGTTLSNPSISTGVWYHWAMQVNSSGFLSAWLDGTLIVNNVSYSTSSNTNLFYIGKGYNPNGNSNIHYIDEIRVTYGTRYSATSSFTPSSTQLVNDSTTLGLFHCESTTQTDDTA